MKLRISLLFRRSEEVFGMGVWIGRLAMGLEDI